MDGQSQRLETLTKDFLGLLPRNLADHFAKNASSDTGKTTAFFTDTREQKSVTIESISQWDPQRKQGLLVVKNISLRWIVTLADVSSIDLSFFKEHVLTTAATSPWSAVFPHGEFEKRKATASNGEAASADAQVSWHVDGVIEYCTQNKQSASNNELCQRNMCARLQGYSPAYGWNASVRFSYCKSIHSLRRSPLAVHAKLTCRDIVLVDEPPSFLRAQSGQEYNQLWLPLSNNRGGVMLPSIYGAAGPGIIDAFSMFGAHPWHVRALQALPAAGRSLTPALFFYLVISSTWQSNMRSFIANLEQVAFKDIRRPNIQINDKLHDYRQYLTYLRAQVTMTKQWIPASVQEHIQSLKKALPAREHLGDPETAFNQILFDAKTTDRFLMDSFQLLMSSMSVLDAQRSLSQVSRAQKVTTLAFVYVPLSFVTGVFGMNVAEINGSPLSVWVPVVVLVVTAICTLIVFGWSWIQKKLPHLWQ